MLSFNHESMNRKNEPMMQTWGRIRTKAKLLNDERLLELVEKFNDDLQKAKIEEEHFITNSKKLQS